MQDIGLFSTFRGLCHSLWHLWELAITGQPIIVVGTKPELVGDAVLAIVSLISPLVFGGDYRPFFSLYDPDFKEVCGSVLSIKVLQLAYPFCSRKCAWVQIVSVHERCRGAGMPCYILGTTNPFFIKSLEFWPNAIWLTPPVAAPPVLGDGSSSPSAAAASIKPQILQPDRIKPRIIPPLTSLSSVLPLPGQDSLAKVCLVCRADALVPPDTRTLGQLLSIKATEELGIVA